MKLHCGVKQRLLILNQCTEPIKTEMKLHCGVKQRLLRGKNDDDVPCTSKTQGAEELKKKHYDNYEVPKLQLWAWMIVAGLHNTDKPLDIPVFQCGVPKKRKKPFAGAITGAVDAFVKLAQQKSPLKNPHGNSPAKVGISVAAVSSAKVVD